MTKILLIISVLFFVKNSFGQNPPEIIDVKLEFQKVDLYNFYIDKANKNHYLNSSHIIGGLVTWTGTISLFGVAFSTDNSGVAFLSGLGGILVGIPFSVAAIIANTGSGTPKKYEKEHLQNAEALFGFLKK